jgi:hypothetical protein
MTIDDQVTARDEAKSILGEAQEVILEIETQVDRVNDLMVELLLLDDLSELAQAIADDLGGTANSLFKGLDERLDELRKEIVANDDDGEPKPTNPLGAARKAAPFSSNEGVTAMNTDADQKFPCVQCKQDSRRLPDGALYVKWEENHTDGIISETFCSWDCAALWFHTQAGRKSQASLSALRRQLHIP